MAAIVKKQPAYSQRIYQITEGFSKNRSVIFEEEKGKGKNDHSLYKKNTNL